MITPEDRPLGQQEPDEQLVAGWCLIVYGLAMPVLIAHFLCHGRTRQATGEHIG